MITINPPIKIRMVLIALIFSFSCSVNQNKIDAVDENVESESVRPKISSFLLGQNYWMDLWEQRDVIFPLVRESGVKIIRIGGIGYDHDLSRRSNEEIETWIDDIKGAGAEPMLQVSRFADVNDAVRWVKYFNVETKNRIQYWNIGNEPNIHRPPGIEAVYDYVVKYARAMKEVDPTITIFVPDDAGYKRDGYVRLCGGDLDITGEKIGDTYLIDGFSWHLYAFWYDYARRHVMDRVQLTYRPIAQDLRKLMAAADAKHNRQGDQKLKWGIGEFNINVNIDVDSDSVKYKTTEGVGHQSFLSGQFYAELFGMCMEEEAYYAATWNIHEKGNRYTNDFGYLDGPMDNPTPRSNYWHMWMLAHNFSGEYCQGTSNQAWVKSFGCRDDKGYRVMLINMYNNRDFEFSLRLDDQSASQDKALAININADSDTEHFDQIPNQTTVLLSFDNSGKLIKKISYDIQHALDTKEPTVETF
ncbi:MAG: hypothetical protein JXQ96_01625 [Cyclobacteriaceae bacterium]